MTAISSTGSLDALFTPNLPDAGGSLTAQTPTHVITITRCSASQSCPPPTGDDPADATYRVVFGAGQGTVRSRSQAVADLYKELRDRTQAGQRLDAEFYARADAGTRVAGSAPRGMSGNDALAQCALHLLELADGPGEVAIDVVHPAGDDNCMVSMGRVATDAGASQCLVQQPERERRPGGGRGGFSF
jgi:hypothetical protein